MVQSVVRSSCKLVHCNGQVRSIFKPLFLTLHENLEYGAVQCVVRSRQKSSVKVVLHNIQQYNGLPKIMNKIWTKFGNI